MHKGDKDDDDDNNNNNNNNYAKTRIKIENWTEQLRSTKMNRNKS
jgi:hypothetical protein